MVVLSPWMIPAAEIVDKMCHNGLIRFHLVSLTSVLYGALCLIHGILPICIVHNLLP